MNLSKLFLILILFFSVDCLFGSGALERPAADSLNRKKLNLVISSASTLFAVSQTGLYLLWYADYPKSSLHLFNDNREWLKMDKAGHATTSYYVGKIGYESLRWTGLSENKSAWYGGMWGFAYLLTVELFDGYSQKWGFSPGDIAANTFGYALFMSQQLAWHEQKIQLKWSFHKTGFAQYNPDQLGSTLPQRAIKDYNGQTYWLSANIRSIAHLEGNFPPWLNLAFGYGADGMIAANSNPTNLNGKTIPTFDRFSQFYLAPDIDLSRIPVKSKTLKLLLNTIGFIKFPMPALEMNKNGFKLHALYF